MSTRAAVRREAALLQEAVIASKTLSSPPSTPTDTETPTPVTGVASEPVVVRHASVAVVIGVNGPSMKLPTPRNSAKRKRAPRNARKIQDSVKIELDVLPHGLGRKGDLLSDATVGSPKPQKRSGRSRVALNPDDVSTMDNDIGVKVKDQTKVKGQLKSEPTSSSNGVDPDITELLEAALPKKRGRGATTVNSEESKTYVGGEDFGERPKKKRALPGKRTLNASKDVVDKDNDKINTPSQQPKKRQKKANKYGLTPGESPFLDHAKPTLEDCEEVNRLLSALHGEVKPPDVIPPPSMEVTGCGEVPDILDAILRTLLSAATTSNNSNMSLQGLKNKFHLRESGVGKGSINWEAVHKADLDDVIDAIKSGGLAKVKGTNIKKILDVVYEQNYARRDALLEEKHTGKPADTPGANNMTNTQKDIEITRVTENMLSMDHLFEMTTDEAMEEMTKLPGIGVKTASCVILFCMKRPSFAVDTHVWRHCKWLGWVPENATRDQTFSHCEVRVPDHLKYSLHQLFLKHGKTCGRCRANTSAGSEDWENADCPIDHLVNRTGKRKLPGNTPIKAKSGNKKQGAKKGTKGKKQHSETEDSDVSIDDDVDESEPDYEG